MLSRSKKLFCNSFIRLRVSNLLNPSPSTTSDSNQFKEAEPCNKKSKQNKKKKSKYNKKKKTKSHQFIPPFIPHISQIRLERSDKSSNFSYEN